MIRSLQADNKFTKALFAVIIGAAIISMVIYLVPGMSDALSGGGNGQNYATVHSPGFFSRVFGASEPVTNQEVTRLAERQLQQRGYPPQLLPYIKPQVAQQLIQGAILKLEADKLGLQVSDEDLRKELHQGQIGQILFPDGKFIGDDAYMNFVQNQLQMKVEQFESLVKRDLEIGRLESLITSGVTVSDRAARQSYLISGTKVKFDYAVISADALRTTINPSDAELQTFFKSNAARYATAVPETRKLSYFSFGIDDLPSKPTVTPADVQSYYNAHLAQYQVKDQARARHILIAVKSPAEDAAAKAKAEDVLKQLKAGGNFAELAKKYSDDPGSKDSGGELGFMQPGQTVPEFNQALFSQPVGQLSNLIKTKFGYHIIQVEERQTAHTRPLAEVAAEITPLVQQQKVAAAEDAYAKQLTGDAKKDGLAKAAAAHNLHVVTTDYLQKDGTVAGVADSSALLAQAFSATKNAPASVSVGDGYAVFQVDDIRAPHAPDFAAYKAKLLEDYRDQKAPGLLNAQLQQLDARAKQLGDLHKAADELHIPVKSSDLVSKTDQVPGVGPMSGSASVAFTLAKGAISDPINTGHDGVVLAVTDKQEPSPDDIAKNLPTAKDAMLNERREEVFRLYLGTLVEKYQKANAIRMAPSGTNTPAPPPL